MLSVEEVKTPAQLEEFLALPWNIYAGDHNWVPPLKHEVKKLLDRTHHPFWQHARGVLFLAYLSNRPVGRISAQIDDNYNELWKEKLGSFGFFECIDNQEVASALLDAAASWLKSQAMHTLRGPMSPSSNDEWGLLIRGFDRPPAIMMPYNPPYYERLLENAGLHKAKDLLAFIKYARTPMPERLTVLARKLKENPRITVRPVNMSDLKNEMKIIKELYNASWQMNWGFSPMTDEEMDLMARQLKTFAEPQMILLAFYDNKPAGLSITLPDINQVIRRLNGRLGFVGTIKFLHYRRKITGARALVFGFKAEYRRLGLPVLLFYETEQYMRRRGYKWCELSWNLEDNRLINEFDRALGAREYKRYRVYERPL